MPDNRRASEALENSHLNLLWTHGDEPIESARKTLETLTRQSDDQIRMNVHTRVLAEIMEVLLHFHHVLTPADVLRSGFVETLDADFELQRAGWKARDHLAQRVRQSVRHHFEVHEQAVAPAV